MSKGFYTTIRLAAIGCLALLFVFNTAWATTYSGSTIVKKGNKGPAPKNLVLVPGEAEAQIKKTSLDSYLTENSINEVQINATMVEEKAACGNGTSYNLSFTFTPSGAYFDSPMTLMIGGEYINPSCPLWLLDEAGKPLEGTRTEVKDQNNRITQILFEINHFSTYNYTDTGNQNP